MMSLKIAVAQPSLMAVSNVWKPEERPGRRIKNASCDISAKFDFVAQTRIDTYGSVSKRSLGVAAASGRGCVRAYP